MPEKYLTSESISEKLGIPKELLNAYIPAQQYLKAGEDYLAENGDLKIYTPCTVVPLASLVTPEHYQGIVDLITSLQVIDYSAYQNALIAAFPEFIKNHAGTLVSKDIPQEEKTLEKPVEKDPGVTSDGRLKAYYKKPEAAPDRIEEDQKEPAAEAEPSNPKENTRIKETDHYHQALKPKNAIWFKARDEHFHQINKMKCGQKAICIAYNSASSMIVRFEDGTLRTSVQYIVFKNGEVSHNTTKRDDDELIKALFGYSSEDKCYISIDGRRHATMKTLCNAFGVNYEEVRRNILKYHITFTEFLALNKPDAIKQLSLPAWQLDRFFWGIDKFDNPFALPKKEGNKAGKALKTDQSAPEEIQNTDKAEKKATSKQAANEKADNTQPPTDNQAKEPSDEMPLPGDDARERLKAKYPPVKWNDIAKHFKTDSIECPDFTEEEKDWLCYIMGLMKKSKTIRDCCGSKFMNARRLVYDRMTSVYTIVWKQEIIDYRKNNNMDPAEPVSYFRVAAQSPKLRSLFEPILIDWIEGNLVMKNQKLVRKDP